MVMVRPRTKEHEPVGWNEKQEKELVEEVVQEIGEPFSELKEVVRSYKDVFPQELPAILPQKIKWDMTVPLKENTKPISGPLYRKVQKSWTV